MAQECFNEIHSPRNVSLKKPILFQECSTKLHGSQNILLQLNSPGISQSNYIDFLKINYHFIVRGQWNYLKKRLNIFNALAWATIMKNIKCITNLPRNLFFLLFRKNYVTYGTYILRKHVNGRFTEGNKKLRSLRGPSRRKSWD